MFNPTNISISMEEYADLRHDAEILAALHAAGVDSWEGYDVAMTLLEDGEELDFSDDDDAEHGNYRYPN